MKAPLSITVFLLLSFFFQQELVAQNAKADKAQVEALKKHVEVLAADEMGGREAGTEGEEKAYLYISEQMKLAGLKPAGDDGFLQEFDFRVGKTVGEKTKMELDYKELILHEDYYPLNYSAQGFVEGDVEKVNYGLKADSVGYNDYLGLRAWGNELEGSIFLINLSVPEGYHPHSKYADYMDVRDRLRWAEEEGATGVIFFSTETAVELPKANYNRNVTESSIPAIVLTESGYFKLDYSGGFHAKVQVVWDRDEREGHNILGYINNKADQTVVIGAHYDHLGMGKFGSLYEGEPAIHNGADDNASGVSVVLELARILEESSPKNNNYLFIAFSGEELGLYGSKSYTKSSLFDGGKLNYMINLDMVGRLDAKSRKLAINGAGSSEAWASETATIDNRGLAIQLGEAGIGASDHTSFYLEDIPAVHFFTGSHGDYHRPSDDADKVNYEGMKDILFYINDLITALDDNGKIEFTEVVADEQESVRSFKVTLGVIPDYMFSGEGMRIESVRKERPAALAGLQDGDVVLQMGPKIVSDMSTYMSALNNFNKGEEALVKVLRGEETLEFTVTF